MMDTLKILLVDDDQWVREELDEFLSDEGYQMFQAGLPSEALRLLTKHEPDIVILDQRLPEMDGIQVLKRIKATAPDTETIMITGHGNMENVIQAMRLGASDYLTKPFRLAEVQAAIERTQKFIQINKQLKKVELNYSVLSKQFYENRGYHIIGDSPEMQTVMDLITKVAQSAETSVLIIGESGTGKELIARGIHQLSPRKDQIFCSVNMSAVTSNLFESEFFGYKKGAFTGASKEKTGWFHAAHHGTLFLDEVGSMPLQQQTKLLRVLEEKTITKVGDHAESPVDVRIIAATNRDIQQLIADDKFREDLYYRLSAFVIHVPSLRERKEDIPFLVENFVQHFSRKTNKPIKHIEPSVFETLMIYDFPGNIRELKNIVERAVILCEGTTLYSEHFPFSQDNTTNLDVFPPSEQKPGRADLDSMLANTEKRLILEALDQAEGNKSQAAKLLHISRQSLHRRIKKLGLFENRTPLSA